MWPHDTVIAAAGMAAYGRRDAALRVVGGLLDALEAFGGRLPELFCGFPRDEKPIPIPYPTSCSPQAWAAATPFEMLRIVLDLRADATRGALQALPSPSVIGEVHIGGLPFSGLRLGIDADTREAHVDGLPSPARAEERGRMTP